MNFINYNLEMILSRTLSGKLYYLRNNTFQSILYDKYKTNYYENFKLPNNFKGEFKVKIDKNGFKNVNIFSFYNQLRIYKNDKIFLSENLEIIKRDLSMRILPNVNHKLIQRERYIQIDEIDNNLYKDLISKKEIIISK
jgi:hypothetical protein